MAEDSNQVKHELVSTRSSSHVQNQNYLFMGNPGTGKSTLINCLIGDAVFDAGISYGGGLTNSFQKISRGDIHYMDTPGLADCIIREEAAAAITEALQQSGSYKLFFMVRLENGRVVSDDLATIQVVLDSVALDAIPFAVIVNNVKKNQYAKMMKKETDYQMVLAAISSIKYKASHVVFIPVIEELEEEDNAVTYLPTDAQAFIRSEAPTVNIFPQDISFIKIHDLKLVSKALRDVQEQLLMDNKLLKRKVEELAQKSGCSADFNGRLPASEINRLTNTTGSLKHAVSDTNTYVYGEGGAEAVMTKRRHTGTLKILPHVHPIIKRPNGVETLICMSPR